MVEVVVLLVMRRMWILIFGGDCIDDDGHDELYHVHRCC